VGHGHAGEVSEEAVYAEGIGRIEEGVLSEDTGHWGAPDMPWLPQPVVWSTETVTLRLTFPVDAPASGTRYYLRARAAIP